MLKRLHITISGSVQGVGFRFFAQDSARSHGLTGWVRNLMNGDVEAEAQGDCGEVDQFVKDLGEGPPLGHVSDVHTHEVPVVEGEGSFRITF